MAADEPDLAVVRRAVGDGAIVEDFDVVGVRSTLADWMHLADLDDVTMRGFVNPAPGDEPNLTCLPAVVEADHEAMLSRRQGVDVVDVSSALANVDPPLSFHFRHYDGVVLRAREEHLVGLPEGDLVAVQHIGNPDEHRRVVAGVDPHACGTLITTCRSYNTGVVCDQTKPVAAIAVMEIELRPRSFIIYLEDAGGCCYIEQALLRFFVCCLRLALPATRLAL